MTLEEKIALLSPDLRSQVEDYVDFLISRMPDSDLPSASSFSDMDEEEEDSADNISFSGSRSSDAHNPSPAVRGRAGSSGIILAEERPVEENTDSIDFADINSRFGHTQTRKNRRDPAV
jgi:hypothetical protein